MKLAKFLRLSNSTVKKGRTLSLFQDKEKYLLAVTSKYAKKLNIFFTSTATVCTLVTHLNMLFNNIEEVKTFVYSQKVPKLQNNYF